MGPVAKWAANFRDLNGAVRRMATLCRDGGIGVKDVDEEIARLSASWRDSHAPSLEQGLAEQYLGSRLESLDRFDRVQLEDVLRVCQSSRNMAHAGKELFAHSRSKKRNPNDSDRIRKYLARFGLRWDQLDRRS